MENEILVKIELLDDNDPDRFEILSFNAGLSKESILRNIARGEFSKATILNIYLLDNNYNEVERIY